MNANLLQQLLTKPVPQTRQAIEVILPQIGDVALQTKIIDKTNLGYDGDALRRRLQRLGLVRKKTSLESVEEEVATKPPPPAEPSSLGEAFPSSLSPVQKQPKKTKKVKPSRAISIMIKGEEEAITPEELALVVDNKGKTIGERLHPPTEQILIQTTPLFSQ